MDPMAQKETKLMVSQVDQEKVLVIPTSLLRQIGYFQGFSADVSRYAYHLFDPSNTSFRPRGEVEPDPEFKQLIPYVLICYAPQATWHVFCYTRGTGQGESRLHRKRSIGIGGHISEEDSGEGRNLVSQAIKRELNEEVAINASYQMECVGLINDDTTDVGRVHLGIVYRCVVSEPAVMPREKEIVSHGFLPLQELAEHWNEFETWSQIALKGVFGIEPSPSV